MESEGGESARLRRASRTSSIEGLSLLKAVPVDEWQRRLAIDDDDDDGEASRWSRVRVSSI